MKTLLQLRFAQHTVTQPRALVDHTSTALQPGPAHRSRASLQKPEGSAPASRGFSQPVPNTQGYVARWVLGLKTWFVPSRCTLKLWGHVKSSL